jgi:hypothetical protein
MWRQRVHYSRAFIRKRIPIANSLAARSSQNFSRDRPDPRSAFFSGLLWGFASCLLLAQACDGVVTAQTTLFRFKLGYFLGRDVSDPLGREV